MKKGQSLVEYLVLFVLIAALSWLFWQNVKQPFRDYVANATKNMTEE